MNNGRKKYHERISGYLTVCVQNDTNEFTKANRKKKLIFFEPKNKKKRESARDERKGNGNKSSNQTNGDFFSFCRSMFTDSRN